MLNCPPFGQQLPCHQSWVALRRHGRLTVHTMTFSPTGQRFVRAHDTEANTEGQVRSAEVQHDGQRLGWKPQDDDLHGAKCQHLLCLPLSLQSSDSYSLLLGAPLGPELSTFAGGPGPFSLVSSATGRCHSQPLAEVVCLLIQIKAVYFTGV